MRLSVLANREEIVIVRVQSQSEDLFLSIVVNDASFLVAFGGSNGVCLFTEVPRLGGVPSSTSLVPDSSFGGPFAIL